MKLVVTGGGTGGHVFPALEIGLRARDAGWDVHYLGSQRGQEGRACERERLPFMGFPAQPLYRLTTPRGIRSALGLIKATSMAKRALHEIRPDVIFSTGGYSSGPVVSAAKSLGIPYVIHEQNSVPGRSNVIFSREAFRIATVFHATARHFPPNKLLRTGMPLRRELRRSEQGSLGWTQGLRPDADILLVMGGSQGAAALNDAALATAVRLTSAEVQWLHITGESHFQGTSESLKKLAIKSHYEIKAYLEADEMASALFACSLAICRSGAGTLAELAAFRKPAILIPYPNAFGDHQLHNAREFEQMGAATMLQQADLVPSTLEARIHGWLCEPEWREQSTKALADWDVPDASERILDLIGQAAKD